MRDTPILVLVSGDPASGKSTIAEGVSARYRLPLIRRDEFKEALFDTLGWQDRVWSQRLGKASFALLLCVANRLLASDSSLVIDCNLNGDAIRKALRDVVPQHYCCLEVCCTASPEVLIERFVARASTGKRHPGHVDTAAVGEFAARLGTHPQSPALDRSAFLLVNTNRPIEGVLTEVYAAIDTM